MSWYKQTGVPELIAKRYADKVAAKTCVYGGCVALSVVGSVFCDPHRDAHRDRSLAYYHRRKQREARLNND